MTLSPVLARTWLWINFRRSAFPPNGVLKQIVQKRNFQPTLQSRVTLHGKPRLKARLLPAHYSLPTEIELFSQAQPLFFSNGNPPAMSDIVSILEEFTKAPE